MIRIKSDKILLKDKLISGYIYFENGIIAEVSAQELPFESEYDFSGLYVSPGFIDIHTHGGGGFSFDGSCEDVAAAADFHLAHGTTSIYPTVSAAPMDVMVSAAESIKQAMDGKMSKANIMGIHMEGPYLSAKQCGAQCPDFIKNPDAAEYAPVMDKYGDCIARWSYAPENDTDGSFCRYITERGMTASAGHTDAIYQDMLTAMENGCRLVTHLYSCVSTITRDHGFRRLGVIETALLHDELYAEIIADGKHLPPELIRLILKAKGTDRVALITDSLSLAGTEAKTGIMQATEYVIEDGVCKLLDRSAFAGSIATADRLVRVVKDDAGFPLAEAVKMITYVPANIMKLNKGELLPGRDADIVVFDEDINISHVFVMGNKVI